MTYHTVSNGYWNDTMVWAGHVIPPYSSSDSFIIDDSIRSEHDLIFDGAYVQIDSTGGLCGHYLIKLMGGSLLINSGYFEIDSLYQAYADMITKGYGIIRHNKNWLMELGGSNITTEHAFDYGGFWDTCFGPRPPIDSANVKYEFKMWGNLCNGIVNFGYTQPSPSRFLLFDILGQKVFETELTGKWGNRDLYLNHIANGLYFWNAISDNDLVGKGKLVIKR